MKSISLLVAFVVAAGSLATGCASNDAADQVGEDEVRGATSMKELLAQVPPGTPWKDVKPSIRKALESNADVYLARVRHDWGTKGLDEKSERVIEAPTPAMIENFDRILMHLLAADVPSDFVPSKDITNPELLVQLKRFYVLYCAERQHLLSSTNPEFKQWDGGAVTEFLVRDGKATENQKAFAREIERKIAAISSGSLSDVEKSIVAKTRFVIRQLKYGATGMNIGGEDMRRTANVAGWMYDFVAFNAQLPGGSKAFKDDEELLLAVNAYTFTEIIDVNVGTVDSFAWDLANYVDPGFLQSMGFDPATKEVAKHYVTLAGWLKDRVTSHPDAKARCTVYSARERSELWDAFTAENFGNGDGKQTLQSYQAAYQSTIASRLADIKAIGTAAVDAAFPTGLTPAQLAQVKQSIASMTKPAAIVETIATALDAATGDTKASTAFKAKQDDLTVLGGNYAEGEALRAAEKAQVEAMWNDLRSFLATRYAGRPVNISNLLPATVQVTTSEQTAAGKNADGGAYVTVGLGKSWNKVSLFSTLLHEGKHAIDLASNASVLGAAWEGAALVTEDTVLNDLLESAMASERTKLPFYLLGTAVDNVRLTATTDATLKVILRSSCPAGSPDTIQFAKDVVAGYGYTDPDTLLLRARRAHAGAQYLSYDYGGVAYLEMMKYLQAQIGATPTVEPMLLQACGMPSPNADAAAVAKLKTCLAAK